MEEPHGLDEVVHDFVYGHGLYRLLANAGHPLVIDDLVAEDDAREDLGMQRDGFEALAVGLGQLSAPRHRGLGRWHPKNPDAVGIGRDERVEIAGVVRLELALDDV